MTGPENTGDAERQRDDALLRKARDAVDKQRLANGGSVPVRMEQGAAASLIQRVVDACTAFLRWLSKPFRSLGALFRGPAMRRTGRALAWSAFERDKGAFRLDNEGKRVFSPRRMAKVGTVVVALAVVCYIAIAAAYFHGTKFEELVYTTGKQEIEVGELYQFTGCRTLPCSTEADNGKYYKIETSLFLPMLLYPEQDVYANIPQQNAACYVKGYGIYLRNLRWLYKYAQWYQQAYDISCRPYNEQELLMTETSAAS